MADSGEYAEGGGVKIVDLNIPSHRPYLQQLRDYAEHYCRRTHKSTGSIEIWLTPDEWKQLKAEVFINGPWYCFSIPSKKFMVKAGVSVTVREDRDAD